MRAQWPRSRRNRSGALGAALLIRQRGVERAVRSGAQFDVVETQPGADHWVCAAWHRDVYQPWVIEAAALRERRTRLLSTALGLDHDEPEDLLELLAATSS